jgi:hypothetical protein
MQDATASHIERRDFVLKNSSADPIIRRSVQNFSNNLSRDLSPWRPCELPRDCSRADNRAPIASAWI